MSLPQNDLAEIFSSILYNISDYEKQINNISSIFSNTLNEIDTKFFISIDFLDYYTNYPVYPVDFKVINNLNKYNLVSIYNVIQNDVNYLLNAIETPEVLNLKGTMDKIPNVEIKRDYELQTTYFSSVSDELLARTFFGGLCLDKTRRSYLFKTFGYAISQSNKETSLIYEYLMYVFFLKNLRSCLRIYENAFSANIASLALRKNNIYIDAFNEYLYTVKSSFAERLVKYILEYTYKISDPSGKFLKDLVDVVEKKLCGLANIFKESILMKDSISANMLLLAGENLYNCISANFATILTNSKDFISESAIEDLKAYEIEQYNKILDKYSIPLFREYMYLVYYYKNNPRKFLNVLQLMIIAYIKQHLIDGNQNVFLFSDLLNRFGSILNSRGRSNETNKLNLTKIDEFLRNTLTVDYIRDEIVDKKIAEYTMRSEMVSYIEDIFSFKNKDFEKYIDELYDEIFSYLKSTVQVEPYYEFHFNKKMVYWYILGYIKRDVFQNIVFSDCEEFVKDMLLGVLDSEDFHINIDCDKMRDRAFQYVSGNIINITNLFDNILETAVEKKLHSENIMYYFC